MLNEDDILLRELEKLGGGGFGGGNSGGLAGSIGAKVLRKLLTETITKTIVLRTTPERGIRLAFSVLKELGHLESDQNNASPYPVLAAIVQSGYSNMNPALVYLEFVEGRSDTCEVRITAAAKEGLIKQHTADKTIQRVMYELSKVVSIS